MGIYDKWTEISGERLKYAKEVNLKPEESEMSPYPDIFDIIEKISHIVEYTYPSTT